MFSYTYDLIELKMELGIVKVDGNKKIKRELSKETPVREPVAFLKTAVKEGSGTDEEFTVPSHPIQLTVDTSDLI